MKTVKLSEESYNKLKDRLINEISYGTVEHAYDRINDIFWEVRSTFEDFYSALGDAMFKAKYDSREGEQTSNPYLEKIKGCADIIYDILNRKKEQQDKFFDATTGKVDHNKFFKSDESQENDIDDMDLNYLQKNFPK
jgi:hypothetical protein